MLALEQSSLPPARILAADFDQSQGSAALQPCPTILPFPQPCLQASSVLPLCLAVCLRPGVLSLPSTLPGWQW